MPRGTAKAALAKADEFRDAAAASLDASRWNAAGLNAIHAGIAAADAALIASAGIRSVSQDHDDVIGLLEGAEVTFGAAQRRQLTGLLKMKNTVAYEQRLLAELDARRLCDQSERFLKWAAKVVTSHGL